MKRVFRSELRLAASLSCIEPILFSPSRTCGERRDFCVCDARNIRPTKSYPMEVVMASRNRNSRARRRMPRTLL